MSQDWRDGGYPGYPKAVLFTTKRNMCFAEGIPSLGNQHKKWGNPMVVQLGLYIFINNVISTSNILYLVKGHNCTLSIEFNIYIYTYHYLFHVWSRLQVWTYLQSHDIIHSLNSIDNSYGCPMPWESWHHGRYSWIRFLGIPLEMDGILYTGLQTWKIHHPLTMIPHFECGF